MSLEAQANKLGIPMQLKIDDNLRYSYCEAHMATLVEINGEDAVYKGQCTMGHTYQQTFKIAELRAKTSIVNGKLVMGTGNAFKGAPLQEY